MSWQAVQWFTRTGNSRCASAGQKSLLHAVAGHVDKDLTGCWASVQTLARESGMSARTVQRRMRELEALGLIRPSDPDTVAAIWSRHPEVRPDRRPTVWDIPS